MKEAIRWMAGNHVAANLLMLTLLIGGLITSFFVKQEVFPEISLNRITITVPYPGAGPEEIEEGIILKIEDEITGVEGIKKITSRASEGIGTVTAEVYSGKNPDIVLQDIKSSVDRITRFPENAEEPIISRILNRREVISVVVYGEVPERSLRQQAEEIRDELLEQENITQVELSGVRPYEISIEIPEENLRRYNLTIPAVARVVSQASVDLPGGMVKTDQKEILIRTTEQSDYGPGYEKIRIHSFADGREIVLGDIAEVVDGFRETDVAAQFDGQPAAMVKVYRIGDQKPIEISGIVRNYIEEKAKELPPSISIAQWNDTSEIFASRINLLLKNASLGLILVFLIIGVFLEVRLSLWVMLGIPISFLGAILLMPTLDVSINMISLFAFIMALGIVVDDAIVVGENIYEQRQSGKSFLEAAREGTIEMAVPVTFAIITSVAAFVPLIYVTGTMGKFIKVIPLTVISILLLSLIEAFFILPAHLSTPTTPYNKKTLMGKIDNIRQKFGYKLNRLIQGPYRRVLLLSLEFRYVTLAVAVAVLLIAFGLVGGGIVKFHFMPRVAGNEVEAALEMAPGTSIEKTKEAQQYLLSTANKAVRQLERQREEKILRHIYSVTGSSIGRGGPAGGGEGRDAAHIAEISVLLTPSETRKTTSIEVGRLWRELTEEIAGSDSLKITSGMVHMGANIDIQLEHKSLNVLEEAADRVRKILPLYPGVYDIASNYNRGQKELEITLKPAARSLGITEEELGRQLRGAFYGSEALRLQRGRNEVKVMVRYPEKDRQYLESLEDMRIRGANGEEVPLYRAARVEEGMGFTSINRSERKRVVNVTASVDSSKANAEEIITELKKTALPELKRKYEGLSIDMEGESRERQESMISMSRGFLISMLAIYALLAVLFRSYSQPFLVMVAVPFGIIGAILGHLLMGYSLSILSMFGIVALSGVVINDSLLVIDYANRARLKGKKYFEAITEAGTRRFRPVLLTSLTTFFGLSPMILETSTQAKFLIPMAISLAFGILAATGITVLLLPSLYIILEDIHLLFQKDKENE